MTKYYLGVILSLLAFFAFAQESTTIQVTEVDKLNMFLAAYNQSIRSLTEAKPKNNLEAFKASKMFVKEIKAALKKANILQQGEKNTEVLYKLDPTPIKFSNGDLNELGNLIKNFRKNVNIHLNQYVHRGEHGWALDFEMIHDAIYNDLETFFYELNRQQALTVKE